jgi:asparagine synthase (glutamine-hydrolysing)
MSGVVALFCRDGSACNPEHVQAMTRALNNRGNQARWWCEGPIGLGAVRWQPPCVEMSQETFLFSWGSSRIAADLRLDNREELLHLLRQHIMPPPGHEEEMVGAAYHLWGSECLAYLRGEYAFVLWDGQNQRLFAARSPTGLRSLVYACTGSLVLCASEARQILHHPAVSPDLNPEWVASWLTHGVARWDMTPFRGLWELAPGTMLLADPETITIEPFWFPPPRLHPPHLRVSACAEQVRWLLEEATKDCMRTEGRVFFDISGGLDSSGLACLSRSLTPRPELREGMHCFSRVYQEKDDRILARRVAETSQMALLELAWEDFPPFADLWEARSWSSQPVIPTLFYHRLYQEQWRLATERQVRVHIRGDQGDQVFGATFAYLHDLWQEHRYGVWMRDALAWRRVPEVALSDLIWRTLRSQPPRVRASAWWTRSSVQAIAQDQAAQDAAWFRHRYPDPFQRRLAWLLLSHSADYSAALADGCLSNGVDIRQPYTDLRLVAFLFACPPQMQCRPAVSKWLLRQALRGILPEEVRLRRSKGRIARLVFQGVARHIRDLRPLVQQVPEIARAFLDPRLLLQAIEQVQLGAAMDQPAFFSTLAFLLWVHRLPWGGGLLPLAEPGLALSQEAMHT